MGFLNATIPIDETLLNGTNVSAILESPTAIAEFPTDGRGLLSLAAVIAVVALLAFALISSKERWSAKEPLALPLVLAALLLSVPLGNTLWMAGLTSTAAWRLNRVLGILQLGLLVAGGVLSARFASEACSDANDGPIIMVKETEHKDEEYPHDYVGCVRCGVILSKKAFF